MSIEAMKQEPKATSQFVEKELTVGQRYANSGQQLLEEIESLYAAIQQAEAKTDEPDDVVREAERYRWLRDRDHWPAPFASSQEPEPIRGTDLDSAIDAAMTAAQAQKGQP